MKRLFILRHAKAVPANEAEDDASRPLSPRGHADAIRLGTWLQAQNMVPTRALCSPAIRTRQTLEDVSKAFAHPPDVTFSSKLYLAPASVLLAEVRKAAEDVPSLMLVGHNPGLENLAFHLGRNARTGTGGKPLRDLAEGLPTCALVVFDFAYESWEQISAANGVIAAHLRPKDLKA